MNNGKSKILIIGGGGYIGTHVLVELLHAGLEVLVIDNFENSFPSSLKKVSKIVSNKFKFLNIDVTNIKLLDKAFKNFIPDMVFHLAGKKNLLESFNFPLQYYQSNVNGLINILNKMDEYGCDKIILSSSAAIYGEPKQIPVSENSLVLPMSVYARTKFFIEENTKDWSISSNNKKAIILRYFNPVGNHKSGEIGENSKLEQNNLFPSILKVLENKKQYFNIYGNDLKTKDGTAIRDFIHVSDLAEVHLSCIGYFSKIKNYDVFNVGSGTGYSIKEIIKKFELIFEKKIPLKVCDHRKGEIPISISNISKANKLLNWYPKENLEIIIRDLMKWKNKNNS